MNDFCQHLDVNFVLLTQLHEAVKRNDRKKVTDLMKSIDWETVSSEFEPVVGSYRSAVYRHGRKIIRNLLKPYYLYDDQVNLRFHMDMLLGAIQDSQSLLISQGEQLERAYQAVLLHDVLHDRKRTSAPDKSPWLTVECLIVSANKKLQFSYALERNGNKDYGNNKRVYDFVIR